MPGSLKGLFKIFFTDLDYIYDNDRKSTQN